MARKYSVLDATNDFAQLSNTIYQIKVELRDSKGVSLLSDDYRMVAFDSMQKDLLSAVAHTRAVAALPNHSMERTVNIGIDFGDRRQISAIFEKAPLESLVTMLHFRIDSLVKKLCDNFVKPPRGFYSRVIFLLDEVGPPRKTRKTHEDALVCLSYFRNTFHDGGQHKKFGKGVRIAELDRKFSRNGHSIEFRHGKVIAYDWRKVYLLIEASVEAAEYLVMEIT